MNKIDENKNDSEKIKVSIFDNLIESVALNKDNKIKGVTGSSISVLIFKRSWNIYNLTGIIISLALCLRIRNKSVTAPKPQAIISRNERLKAVFRFFLGIFYFDQVDFGIVDDYLLTLFKSLGNNYLF